VEALICKASPILLLDKERSHSGHHNRKISVFGSWSFTLRSRKLQGDPLSTPGHSKRGPKVGAATDESIVLDDLPGVIPVTRRELEIIETFLGKLIDRLLLDALSSSFKRPSTVRRSDRLHCLWVLEEARAAE
jgi:hypothetical protein